MLSQRQKYKINKYLYLNLLAFFKHVQLELIQSSHGSNLKLVLSAIELLNFPSFGFKDIWINSVMFILMLFYVKSKETK